MAKDLKMCSLIDTYGAALTDKQYDVLKMYYFEDFSLSEIAELEGGITRQGVRDSIKRGEAVIMELEEKLHFAGRFDSLLERCSAIRKNAKDILAYTDNGGYGGYAGQIRKAALEIVEACDALSALVQDEEDGI